MTENQLRIGNFTSSEIAKLMTEGKAKGTMGKPGLEYIEEKNMERRLGRSLDGESGARPLTWGSLIENRVFDILGTEYQFCSKETIKHPTIDYWVGSPDAIKMDEGTTIVDFKCPITMKSFCQLVDGGTIGSVRENHKDGDKYFWQIISNAILTGAKFGELIVYCPYKSELQALRDLARNYDGKDQSKFSWIFYAEDNELPWLKDGGIYKNLNIIRFDILDIYKEMLTEKVNQAGEKLITIQK